MFQYPDIDRLQPQITNSIPAAYLDHQENTTSGTQDIVNQIYLDFCALEKETAFTENNTNGSLYLAYGDQLTITRVRVCKQRRKDEESTPFEKWNWILPIPALFHLQMAVVQMIQNAHYGSDQSGSSGRRDRSKLRSAQELLGRRRVRPGKGNFDFHPLEQFLIQNFYARIITAAIHVSGQQSEKGITTPVYIVAYC